MIYDFERDHVALDRTFDVCIVGAGAAGLPLARKLVVAGHDVCLIEGGGTSRWERKSQALNKTRNVGAPYASAHSGRFRALGGTTSAWAGQVVPLEALDFEERPWVSGSSWPISKEDLAPFYAEAETMEGIAADLDGAPVWHPSELSQPPPGEDLQVGFSRYCPERKFSRLFADILEDKRLTVLLHANAIELIPTHGRNAIQRIAFRTLGGKQGVCSAKFFVLCLGAIESSRFLLNQPFSPWNVGGMLGRHFQDHLDCFAADVFDAKITDPGWVFGPSPVGGRYFPKIKLTPAAQERFGVLNASGTISYSDGIYSALRTGIKIVAGPTTTVRPRELARMLPLVPAAIWHRYKTARDPNYRVPWAKLKLSVWCEQEPSSASRITLTGKRDRVGLLGAAIDWRISDLELKTIRTYVNVAKRMFRANGLASVTEMAGLHDDRIRDRLIDQFHPCGGTRMSHTPHSGVVDPQLRLHNVENAYVCSSSVFPTSGIANPTHTIVALALRLAAHLNGRLSS